MISLISVLIEIIDCIIFAVHNDIVIIACYYSNFTFFSDCKSVINKPVAVFVIKLRIYWFRFLYSVRFDRFLQILWDF